MSESDTQRSHDPNDVLAWLHASGPKLVELAQAHDADWDLTIEDPIRLHNMYAHNLIAAYASKFYALIGGLLAAMHEENYLVYALCGRAMIELSATCRYFMQKYVPLMGELAQPQPNAYRIFSDMVRLDDQHMRGTRFEWTTFMQGDHQRLSAAVEQYLENKKAKKRQKPTPSTANPQVNVMTCINRWAEDDPMVRVTYDLFCDLVHPNVGSTWLVATDSDGKDWSFQPTGTKSLGVVIAGMSLPLLWDCGYKPFEEYVQLLVLSIAND